MLIDFLSKKSQHSQCLRLWQKMFWVVVYWKKSGTAFCPASGRPVQLSASCRRWLDDVSTLEAVITWCGMCVWGRVLKALRRPRTERSNQYRIKNYLLRNYDKTTRPVINDSAPVNVDVSISLSHILDTVSPCLLIISLQTTAIISR